MASIFSEVVANAGSSEQVVLALIAVIATAVGALAFVIRGAQNTAKDTNEQVREVNRAVNNIGPGEHRLYDKVDHISNELSLVTEILNTVTRELKEHRAFWKDFHLKWGNLPEELDSAADLAVTLSRIRDEIRNVQTSLSKHVEWEENHKYKEGE
jgi:hypothetical protein